MADKIEVYQQNTHIQWIVIDDSFEYIKYLDTHWGVSPDNVDVWHKHHCGTMENKANDVFKVKDLTEEDLILELI